MIRKPYTLKEEELKHLVDGIKNHGVEETQEQMRQRVLLAMAYDPNMDESLMDMYDSVLKRARSPVVGEEDKKILYTLSSMLRILAHEAHRTYIKAGKEKDNTRFLHLVE